ncbi:NeuD/PglB/VioB family sugar acetyltransferase [Pseudomonas sp. R5-89-07]|uniref:NeuD/PglB/VioB family sugar acetyltransferase n=1 Tax=Pseudomonas sp. R5-89-07 TaxID=658644 RepID=UPI000F568981|nr:NeuD/PglB/VioB family sugar acetyltransferase [Pseudomonas sp. R5-89-07]AZF04445.1 bacterial transferase, hexapeptide repeat protein [Pseudomonas sp. R5-89-07]
MSGKKFVIVGAGGFGREVYVWLKDWIDHSDKPETYKIVGFLDDSSTALGRFSDVPSIISSIDDYVHQDGVFLVCAIADPKIKKAVSDRLIAKGAEFFSLVHPSVIVGTRVVVGVGVVVCPNTILSTDLTVGDFVTINSATTIGHDTSIGRYSTISGHCDVTGGVQLGEGVFMGSHAVVVPKVTVGAFAIIGASSVVIRKVAPGVTVFGVPAKKIAG